MLNRVPLRLELDGVRRVLAVGGDVDHGDLARLDEALRAGGKAGDLLVDLTDVTYLPSAAVGVMVQVRRDAAADGSTVLFTAAPGTIAERVLVVMALLTAPAPAEDAAAASEPVEG